MSGEPTFRKASDTRAIPETPKASLESLRKLTGPLSPSKHGPYLGPTPNLPLTSSQASQLLDASGFPRSLERFRKIFVEQFVTFSANLRQNERRNFDLLLERARHPCSKEPLVKDDAPLGAYPSLAERVKEIEELERESKETGEAPTITVAGFVKDKAMGIAAQVVAGFDVYSQEHFVFDKDGRIVDVTEREKGRYLKMCLPYLTSVGLRKAQESQFTQFLKETSDPYKGSQQGVGRTRKHKRKARKTLRRRKMRRNMH